MIVIRQATPDDASRIFDYLVVLTQESAFTHRRPPNPTHFGGALETLLMNPDTGFTIATGPDGGIIGLLVVMVYPDLVSGVRGVCQVCWYITPHHRGTLGDDLLDAGLAWAKGAGATFAEFNAPTEAYVRYYRRRGFTKTGTMVERIL